ALQEALKKINQMTSDGTWKNKNPSTDDVVGIFFARSTYHKYYRKLFAKVYQFPDILSWLRSEPNAPNDISIWGAHRTTIENLMDIVKKREEEVESEEKDSGSGKKEKGKAKEAGKSKSKDKGKEKEKSHKKRK
ncbi:hypothetical protein DXG01_012797, partial [Tephrocybe rancida]